MPEMVTVETYDTEADAEAARRLLEEQGIAAVVVKAGLPSTGVSVELRVPETDVDDALAILSLESGEEVPDEEPEDDGAEGETPRLIVVSTYENEIEAEMARGMLEGEGVTAFVVRQNVGGWYGNIGPFGVKLLVPEDEADTAREMLGIEEEK